MNPIWKSKWVAALRSNKYKQGRGKLCTIEENGERSYCCLGVLTEIVLDEMPNFVRIEEETTSDLSRCIVYDDCLYYLPPSIRELVGGVTSDPLILDKALSSINDNAETPSSFDKIADLIEEHL